MANVLIGGSSCAPCCWRTTTTCPDSLSIDLLWDGTPVPGAFIQTAINFNGRGWVAGGGGGGSCTSDTYLSFSSNPVTPPNFMWEVDVWQAFADGVWTSSVAIQIASRQTAPFNTIAFGPEQDSALSCWTSGFSYTGVVSSCPSSMTVVATITIMDDGTLSIA